MTSPITGTIISLLVLLLALLLVAVFFWGKASGKAKAASNTTNY